MTKNRKLKPVLGWTIPLVVALGIFYFVRPALAQFAGEELSEYLKTNNVEVGSAPGENGFRQIYYIYNGQRTFITNTNYTNSSPVTEREYIAWTGQIDSGWRVFLYHIPSGVTAQLTSGGIHSNLQLKNGLLFWEGQEDGVWQIFLFDGKGIKQITQGDVSINPYMEGDYIVYGRRDVAGSWRAEVYSIKNDKKVDVTIDQNAQAPKLVEGKIQLGDGSFFPLTVEDLFVLNLGPLAGQESTPSAITEEDILVELEATVSGQTATESAEVAPEPDQ